jgi:ribokinase
VINARAENAIVVALGANDALTPEHVIAALSKESNLSVVLLQAESSLVAAESALTYARAHGVFSLFNPAPINDGVSASLLSLADCVTPNETEAAFLLDRVYNAPCRDDLATLDDETLKQACSSINAPSILITLGSKGSVLYQREAPHARISGVSQGALLRTPALQVTPIDTTGAGDAFNGGLAAGLVLFGGDLPRAIRYATVVAGLSVERLGTAPAMPTADEVKRFSSFYS